MMPPTQSDHPWLQRQVALTYQRLKPRIIAHIDANAPKRLDRAPFFTRLDANFERLFHLFYQLYGQRYDFFYHLEAVLTTAAQAWIDRAPDLKTLDATREADPDWFQSHQMVGGIGYVDLFAGDLAGIRRQIPYFKELGLTYLHLMPLFKAPQPENDGGYAISSYRDVDPRLGTIEELAALAAELRLHGISLVLDFVFNHTSDEHDWAKRAIAGDPDAQEYYYFFPNRDMPDAYEAHLREIFPDEHPGAFTWRDDLQAWVWTTFHSYQWDLNYSNPATFRAMAAEMLFLANQGIEILRLDAVAFIWKQLGANCENLPEAHLLIQAFNAIARIAAPALLFKSEAIVHPDEVIKYIDPGECPLSYNPLLMALLWETLATRKVELLQHSMATRFHLPAGCAWINYVRCHDDIGWTFSDEDAAHLGIDGYGHRQFLNAFYTGSFPGSFARGLTFQANPRTGDARISGMAASLAGLEQAHHHDDANLTTLAIRRLLLIHSIILSIGGIPLIYLGDEIGLLNDYSYRNHPGKAHDSRWVHRPAFDWDTAAQRHDDSTIAGRLFTGLKHLIELRKNTPAFAGAEMQVVPSGSPHVFAYIRTAPPHLTSVSHRRVLVLANFSENAQVVPANQARLHGLAYAFTDLISGTAFTLDHDLTLPPYHVLWLAA